MAPARLHTLLALLSRLPPRAATDNDEDHDVDEHSHVERSKKVGAAAAARTCVIVATTALDDATLAHLGLLPKFARRFVLPLVETPAHAAALLAAGASTTKGNGGTQLSSCPADVEAALAKQGRLAPREVLHMTALAATTTTTTSIATEEKEDMAQ